MTTLIRWASTSGLPHFVVVLLLAVVLAGAAALLDKRCRQQRLYFAVWVFVTWTGAVIAGSWLMFAIHG